MFEPKTAFRFRIEMLEGQKMRQVDADTFGVKDGWLVFYRGDGEYWRTRTDVVVSMETVKGAA